MHLEFMMIIWKDQTTPRLACRIYDPNKDPVWLSRYYLKHERNAGLYLFEHLRQWVRQNKGFHFMKPLTVTTQFLTNVMLLKEQLARVTLEFFWGDYHAAHMAFTNFRIHTMDRFTVFRENRMDEADPGMYHGVNVSADVDDSGTGMDRHRHHRLIEKWYSD